MTINLTVPNLAELKPRITVFGVGGAGGNAVNNMIAAGLEGVEFVVANTDAQALAQSTAERRIQMGSALTQGLGAGSQPQVGAGAAEEALPEIADQLAGAHMVFITAGMGGGTGTGAAPVVARAAKEQGILTIGVVTKPFHFEGQRRLMTAERGIEQLTKHVDTLIVIPNQNLFRVANEKTTFAAAFAMADQVLYSGVASITELMTKEGLINLDFADVRAIMSEMGKAMMGTGEASGEKRAIEAAEAAISNPLLDDVSMRGARGLLISIAGGPDLTLYEVDEAATRIREEVDSEANIILGAAFDETLDGTMRVSVVATGLVEEGELADSPDNQEDGEHLTTYGYTNAQPVREPAPMAARPMATEIPSVQPAASEQPVKADPAPQEATTAEAQTKDEETPAVANAPRANTAASAPRMPVPEEFPPIAQQQLAAQSSDASSTETTSEPKKQRKGLLERLARVGLGTNKRDTGEIKAPEAASGTSEPRIIVDNSGAEEKSAEPTSADTTLDDEQLEIPAFLRRQAN